MKKIVKKQIIIGMIAAIVMLVFGFLCFQMVTKGSAESTASEVVINAGNNEELVYGTLTSVVGNEITCEVTGSGEVKSYQIPVGTKVTTRLGTVTTFSRLSKGNSVAVLLEKGTDVVKEVWIVE